MCGHDKLGYFQEIIPTHNFEHFGRYIQLIGLIGFEENNFPPMEDSTKFTQQNVFKCVDKDLHKSCLHILHIMKCF